MPDLLHTFDELPLTASGHAFAYGRAHIEYDDTGDWRVSGIDLEHTYEMVGPIRPDEFRARVSGYVSLPMTDPVYALIVRRLLADEGERIDEAVDAALADDGCALPDYVAMDRADYRARAL